MKTQFAKNIAENWFETQKKAIKIVSDAQEKVITHDALKDFTENNAKVYKNWLAEQEKIVSDQLETLGKQDVDFMNINKGNNTMENMMDQFKTMSESFMNTQKKFYENMTNTSETKTGFESFSGMFDQWQKNWMENTKKFSSNFENNPMMKSWNDMVGQFDSFMAFNKMMAPFFENMKNNNWDMKDFEKYFNTKDYMSFINNMMGFNNQSSDMMNEMTKSWKQYTEQASAQATQFFPTVYGWQKSYFENMNNFMKPFEMMMAPDSNKMNMDAMKDIIETTAKFNIKGAEFQQSVYTASIEALQSAVKEISEKMTSEDDHITDMRDFYSIFMKNMDKHLVGLYNTKEYSKLQGEFSQLGFQLKKMMDDSFENMMSDTPFVMNTQMDDMAKTVTSMKREIRSLKKELKEMKASMPEMTKKTTKTTKK